MAKPTEGKEKKATVKAAFPCITRVLPQAGESKEAYRKRFSGIAAQATVLMENAADNLFSIDPAAEATDAVRETITKAAGLARLAGDMLAGKIAASTGEKRRLATPHAVGDALVNATPSLTQDLATASVSAIRDREIAKARKAPLWKDRKAQATE